MQEGVPVPPLPPIFAKIMQFLRKKQDKLIFFKKNFPFLGKNTGFFGEKHKLSSHVKICHCMGLHLDQILDPSLCCSDKKCGHFSLFSGFLVEVCTHISWQGPPLGTPPPPDYHCGDSHFVRFGMRINSVKGTIGSFWIFLDQNCRQSSKNWHFEKKIHWKSTLTRPKCVSWWKETFSFLDPPSPQNGIQATQCFQHSSWKGKNKKLRHKPAKTNWHQQ